MPDYKNTSRFKKPFTSGGSSRSRSPYADGPREMHQAKCSNCSKPCEVPFKPNGKKPVFCKDCFSRDGDRPAAPSYQKKEYGPARESRPYAAPAPDRRIDDLTRQLANVEAKLDTLLQLAQPAPTSLGDVVSSVTPKKAVVKKAKAVKK